ncbi:MAG: hypothetical protein PHQ23_04010 [Candidatus Wallbacteria bacterium]|nr:hypothetical protein [Candidatus Wallbacteria bacterium]
MRFFEMILQSLDSSNLRRKAVSCFVVILMFAIILLQGMVPREHPSCEQLRNLIKVAGVRNFDHLMDGREKVSKEEMGRILATILIDNSIVSLNVPGFEQQPLFWELRSALPEMRDLSRFLARELRDYSIDLDYLEQQFDLLEKSMSEGGRELRDRALADRERVKQQMQSFMTDDREADVEVVRVTKSGAEPVLEPDSRSRTDVSATSETFRKKGPVSDAREEEPQQQFREDERLMTHSSRGDEFTNDPDIESQKKTFYEIVKERRMKSDYDPVIRKSSWRRRLAEIMAPREPVLDCLSPSRGLRLVNLYCADIPQERWIGEANLQLNSGGQNGGIDYLSGVYSRDDRYSLYFSTDFLERGMDGYYNSHNSLLLGGRVRLNSDQKNYDRFRYLWGGEMRVFFGEEELGHRASVYFAGSFRFRKWSRTQFLSNIKYQMRNHEYRLLSGWAFESRIMENFPLFLMAELEQHHIGRAWNYNIGLRGLHRRMIYDLTYEDDNHWDSQKVALNLGYKF